MRTGQLADTLDANQAREHLRTILTMDKDNLDKTIVSGQFVISDIQKEIYVIQQKLAKQKGVIDTFSGKRHSKTYQKCYAKLDHVWNRTSALPINEDTQDTRLDLLKEVMNSLWTLESKASISDSEAEVTSEDEYYSASSNPAMREAQHATQASTSTHSAEHTSHYTPSAPPIPLSYSSPNNFRFNETATTVRRVSIQDPPTTRHITCDQNPSYSSPEISTAPPHVYKPHNDAGSYVSHGIIDLKLYKWKLKYSGDKPNESLSEFLTNVLDRCRSRAITPNRLLGNCADLFEGSAKAWYHAFGARIQSWDEFVCQLRSTFLDSDYDYRLKEEIRQRKQGRNENISIFIAKMINLFSLLSVPMSTADQLEVVEHNILPNYQRSLAFSNHKTVEELLQFLLRLEVGEARASRMQDSSRATQPLEPLMQHNPAPLSSNSRPSVPKFTPGVHHRESASHSMRPTSSNVSYCWNCGGPHMFRACDQPWSLFCHGCGLHGVRRRTCPNCSGNGRQPGAVTGTPGENINRFRSNAAANPERDS